MPADEGDALARRRARGGVGRARRTVRRDRQLLRAFHHVAGAAARGRRRPSCSPSTTTAARRRTRPGGSTTIRRSSIPTPAGWTRSGSSGAPSTMPGSRSTSSPSSAGRRRWPRTGPTRRRRWCSSTAATVCSRPWTTTEGGPRRSRPAATLAIHDVFADPADGGRPPYERDLPAGAGERPVRRGGRHRLAARPTPHRVSRGDRAGRSPRRAWRR